MAISNVRFYKLNVLPNFEAKHKGIFVHVTGTMNKTVGKELWMTPPDKDGGNVGRIDLEQWLTKRRIDSIASGLWFGGENGWELLSNETNSGAINDAIEAKINALDAGPYAQAEITTATDSSTLTIKGIKEDNGIIGIPDSENFNLKIAIDGVYTESNKIATKSTVTTAINNLDVNTAVQAVTFNTPENSVNTLLTFKGVKETNGKIEQGDGTDTFTVGDAKLNIKIGSTTIENVFSANAQSDGDIKLDENVFKKDNNNVISVIAKSDVTSGNKLVTEQDIASLGGAMHYKGALTGAQSGAGSWPSSSTVAAGDVYIVTTGFTHGSESNPFEVGDMIVFNTDNDNSNYTVVQSNLTLGIGDGQIAKNVGALADGMLVVGVNSATGKGIKTVEFDVTNLIDTDNKNKRTLTLTSQRPDNELQSGSAEGMPGLFHSVGITDNFTIMGRPMSKSFSISSPNRSISIEKVGDGNSTDAQIDLIWNTVMDA